jgi:hypothetical protein
MMNLSGLNRKILIFCGIAAIFSSCKNVESDIGSNFFQGHSNMLVIDTVTVKMQTVYLDSIATNGTGTVLLGGYKDTLTGTKEVTSYMQIGAPSTQSIVSTYQYDSLRFMLKPNGYVLGDSTEPFEISVHALTDFIVYPNNGTTLYNTSSFSYDPTPLGSWTGRIYPHHSDTLRVPLSDQLGQTLFDAIVNENSTLSTEDLFTHNYLKGLAITSATKDAIFGFGTGDSSAFIRLYYHNPKDVNKAITCDFKITTTGLQFNHVDNDLSGTPFAGLNSHTPGKVIPSSETGNISVLQPLSNLGIKLSFPYLGNLGYLNRYVDILGASMTLTPVPTSYFRDYPLPTLLSIGATMNYYTVVDSLVNSSGVQHGNLVTDNVNHTSYYSYDLTQYLTGEFKVTSNNNRTELLLIPPLPTFNTQFPRLILGSQKASGSNMGIKIRVQLVTYSTN